MYGANDSACLLSGVPPREVRLSCKARTMERWRRSVFVTSQRMRVCAPSTRYPSRNRGTNAHSLEKACEERPQSTGSKLISVILFRKRGVDSCVFLIFTTRVDHGQEACVREQRQQGGNRKRFGSKQLYHTAGYWKGC
jgi:hypothetical protein